MVEYYTTIGTVITTSTALFYQLLVSRKASISLMNCILERMDILTRKSLELQEEQVRIRQELRTHINERRSGNRITGEN